MLDNYHLRGIILKLESRLSDDDRKRLHFFLGNDVPRRIRDDPSLGGTLSLMESLFDQDKINEKDFTFLINAFDEIQCMDAVKLLREHMRRMQSQRIHESIQSLASVMPPTLDLSFEAQDEDKYAMRRALINEREHSVDSTEMINTNKSPVTKIIHNPSPQSNQLSIRKESVLIFILLLSITVLIIGFYRFMEEVKTKRKTIFEEKIQNNQTVEQLIDEQIKQNLIIQQLNTSQSIDKKNIEELNILQSRNNHTIQDLKKQLEESFDKQRKQNERIQQLNSFQSGDNQTIRQLTNQLKQSITEQMQCNQTKQRLSNKLEQSSKEQIKSNQIIKQLQNLRSNDNQTIQQLNKQLQESYNEQRKQNETIQQLKQLQEKSNNMTIVRNELIDSNQNIIVESTKKPTSIDHFQIDANTIWKSDGSTVAANYNIDYGNLNIYPYGLQIDDDDDQTMIIVDYSNHRVIKWKFGALSGQVVAGGNERGNRNDQLNFPTDVIIDKQTDKLIICDRENLRIVQWHRQDGKSGEIIISHVKCFGITMDIDRFLYVSDLEKHEVRRWRIGETQGILIAGGKNGPGNSLDQFNTPHYIFIDHDLTLFISDSHNHRVMKWMKDAKEGIIVAGGQGRGNTVTQLSWPQGIFVDQSGSIYVADCGNNRIMRWMNGSTYGNVVAGGNGDGPRANQFSCPMGLSLDRNGNLYVADYYNNRVQKFDVERI